MSFKIFHQVKTATAVAELNCIPTHLSEYYLFPVALGTGI